jgi:hypothetical protein
VSYAGVELTLAEDGEIMTRGTLVVKWRDYSFFVTAKEKLLQ